MKEPYSRCLPQGSTPFANPDMSAVQLGRENRTHELAVFWTDNRAGMNDCLVDGDLERRPQLGLA